MAHQMLLSEIVEPNKRTSACSLVVVRYVAAVSIHWPYYVHLAVCMRASVEAARRSFLSLAHPLHFVTRRSKIRKCARHVTRCLLPILQDDCLTNVFINL